jgi:hypothetical protein
LSSLVGDQSGILLEERFRFRVPTTGILGLLIFRISAPLAWIRRGTFTKTGLILGLIIEGFLMISTAKIKVMDNGTAMVVFTNHY